MIEDIFESTHRVRAYECDYYGHVNNAIYLNYLEFARMETLEAKGLSLTTLRDEGFQLVILQIDIKYIYPAVTGDLIRICTGMKSYKNTTCTFHQEIFRSSDDKKLADADVTWAVINLQGRPVRIPQVLRDALGFAPLKRKR